MRRIFYVILFAVVSFFDFSCKKEPSPQITIVIATTNIAEITSSSAVSGGDIVSNGATVIERGICWGTSPSPTISNSKTSNGNGTGSFTSNIVGLNPNTTYYVRAYATNSQGTIYGNQTTFATPISLASITTTTASSIGPTTAISGGNITLSGGAIITERGVCWNTSPLPTISNNKTSNGTGIGTFSSSISSLNPNTTYYVRAYATNTLGTSYGNQISFTTTAGLAAISTTSATSVTQNSAVSGGIISSGGGATIIQRGVCWNTNPTPTISNNRTLNGSGIGTFSSSISSLNPNTTYYVRAYATNSLGTAYGNEISFTTSASLPTLTTTTIISISQTAAFSGGIISSDGGATITQRGVCWNTNPTPTISNNRTLNGSGTGTFSSSISSLNPNTTYYVRAYATNFLGTAYGNEILFTTSSNLPSLTTTTITSISQTTAFSGGVISSDGGATITQRGVCWDTNQSPTISDNRTSNGSGIGIFSSSIISLNPNTTYYVRAYAINTSGVGYGNEVNFTTTALGTPTLILPSNGATVPFSSVNFTWSGVTGATSYEINVSRNSSFSGTTSTIAVCGGVSNPSLTLLNSAIVTSPSFCMNTGTTSNRGTWYWRVRAISGTALGNWSTIRFYVKS